MDAKDIRFELTCGACPEQYDAFVGNKIVGYLRLRFGHFTVSCPNVGGEYVYETNIGDSGWAGMFLSDDERTTELAAAREAIAKWWRAHDEHR